jgi:hypothetical protein
MNSTQAIVILKNGMRKYGSILNSEVKQTVIFVPGAETFRDGPFDHLIEYIPIEEIEGIDTYLK